MEQNRYLSWCCHESATDTAEQVGAMMEKNQREVIVMSRSEFVEYLQDKAGERGEVLEAVKTYISQSSLKAYWNDTVGKNVSEPAVVPASQLTSDLYVISKTLYLVGLRASYTYDGRYIILRGYPGLRRAMNGTRYLASNPQIIKMGFGLKGVQSVARGGFILSLVVASGVEVLDYIFNDEKTMVDLVGGIGVEAVKCGLAAFAGYAVGALFTMTGIAALPLAGMAVITCVAAYALNELDNTHNVKQQVVAGLKSLPENLERGLYVVRGTITADWKAELQRELRHFEDWLVRAAEQQVKEFLQRAVMNLFRHRLSRIGF